MWPFLRASLVFFSLALTTAADASATLQFAPYGLKTENHGTQAAEIAWLDVPARHSEPSGPQLRLRIVRLRTPEATRTQAPMIYLAGGPGGSGVGTARGARWPIFDRMRQHGDVLLFDQRGTGESSLPPACPHEAALPLGREELLASQLATAKRCMQFWRAQKLDLDAFNTVESAHDINALRLALAVPKLTLWGMSYGTHLASSVMRLHGEHIERAILMGYEGPPDTYKFPLVADQMLGQIEAMAQLDPKLPTEFKSVLENTRKLLEKLERQSIKTSLLRSSDQIEIGKFEAQLGISVMLIRSDFARHIPLAIGLAVKGEGGLLGEYVQGAQLGMKTFNAMPLAMDIASGVSAERMAIINAQTPKSVLGDVLNFPYFSIGAELGIPDLGDEFRTPLISAIPTLFVTGTLDVRTPPANMQAALPGFSAASQLIVNGAGHDNDLWLSHPEIADTLEAFVQNRWQGVKQLQMPKVEFATSLSNELWRDVRSSLGLPLIGLILLAAIGLPMVLFWWWRRRRLLRRAR